MGFLEKWGEAAYTTLGYFWMALWAFALGYAISSAIRVLALALRVRPNDACGIMIEHRMCDGWRLEDVHGVVSPQGTVYVAEVDGRDRDIDYIFAEDGTFLRSEED